MGDIALMYISLYKRQLIYALILWPFASAALTLPVLAILYHRHGRVRIRSVISSYLVVLYLVALVCYTQLPLPTGTSGPGITYGRSPQLNPFYFISDYQRSGLAGLAQQFANIVFFLPLGFIARRVWKRGFFGATALGFIVSLALETMQLTGLLGIYPFSYRIFDVDDIICNTLGTAIGWVIGALVGVVAPAREDDNLAITHSPGFLRRAVAFSVDLLAMALTGAAAIFAVVAIARPARAALWVDKAADAADLSGDTWLLSVSGIRHALSVGADYVASAFSTPGMSRLVVVTVCVMLVLFEVLLPWLRKGRTVGGGYVHMSIETRPRKGALRFAFYAARLATIALALVYPLPALVVLGAFWLIAHKMPYDFIPATPGMPAYVDVGENLPAAQRPIGAAPVSSAAGYRTPYVPIAPVATVSMPSSATASTPSAHSTQPLARQGKSAHRAPNPYSRDAYANAYTRQYRS